MTIIVIEAGNFREAVAVFTAPPGNPAAASTGVRFTLTEPDGTETVVVSPLAAIAGPVAGSSSGLTTTTWTWTTPVFDQPGRHFIVAESIAGLLAAHESWFLVLAIHT